MCNPRKKKLFCGSNVLHDVLKIIVFSGILNAHKVLLLPDISMSGFTEMGKNIQPRKRFFYLFFAIETLLGKKIYGQTPRAI